MVGENSVHLVVLIHGLWGELTVNAYQSKCPTLASHLSILFKLIKGAPEHLFAAKEELQKAWDEKHGIRQKDTAVKGSEEDPTITTTIKPDTAGRGALGQAGSGEELVIMIAGGMTSKLTYDGIDVCASRVAWEVSDRFLVVLLVVIGGQNH
jgi:hypothetical protein